VILAFTDGTLIGVTLLTTHTACVRVGDYKGNVYYSREGDTDRKLFKGEDSVHDAMEWRDNLSQDNR
jgi:hypothetical protein